MHTVSLPFAELKAVAVIAPKNDFRFYINGVLVQSFKGCAVMVATDGNRLTACKTEQEYSGPEFIIPTDLIAQVKKPFSSLAVVLVQLSDDGEITIQHADGKASAQQVEGKFPDWQRVIPQAPSGDVSPDCGFNAAYVADYVKMHKALGQRLMQFRIIANNASAAIVDIGRPDFVCVLMPMKCGAYESCSWLAEAPAPELAEAA